MNHRNWGFSEILVENDGDIVINGEALDKFLKYIEISWVIFVNLAIILGCSGAHQQVVRRTGDTQAHHNCQEDSLRTNSEERAFDILTIPYPDSQNWWQILTLLTPPGDFGRRCPAAGDFCYATWLCFCQGFREPGNLHVPAIDSLKFPCHYCCNLSANRDQCAGQTGKFEIEWYKMNLSIFLSHVFIHFCILVHSEKT